MKFIFWDIYILGHMLNVPKYPSKLNEDIPVLIFIHVENWMVFSGATVRDHFQFSVLPVTPPSAQPLVLFIITNHTVRLCAYRPALVSCCQEESPSS